MPRSIDQNESYIYIRTKVYTSDMIELGGNIKLDGFSIVDAPTLIVVKKIVGNYAKKLQEETGEFNELLLTLSKQEKDITLQAKLSGKKSCQAKVSDTNLFFAMNKALEQLMKEATKE